MILEDVIAKLLELFAPAAGVDVYDGPVPTAANKDRYVLVGSSAEDEDGATVTSELSNLGPGQWHDEAGQIVCSAWSSSGGTRMQDVRRDALELANRCVDAIYADRTLGGVLTPPGLAEVTDHRCLMRQMTSGALCRVTFTVTYSHLNT